MISKTITKTARGLSMRAGLDINPEDIMYAMAYGKKCLDDVTDVIYLPELSVIRVRRLANTGRMSSIAGVRLSCPGLSPLKVHVVALAYTVAKDGAVGRWVAYNPTAESVVDQLYLASFSDRNCLVSPYTLAAVLRQRSGMPVCDIVDALCEEIAFALDLIVLHPSR